MEEPISGCQTCSPSARGRRGRIGTVELVFCARRKQVLVELSDAPIGERHCAFSVAEAVKAFETRELISHTPKRLTRSATFRNA